MSRRKPAVPWRPRYRQTSNKNAVNLDEHVYMAVTRIKERFELPTLGSAVDLVTRRLESRP